MTDGDEFDRRWREYEAMDRDLSERLGLEPIADDDDARKERARDMWEAGRLAFIGTVPVITADGDGGSG